MIEQQEVADLAAQFPIVPIERIRSLCDWVNGLTDCTNPKALVAKKLTQLQQEYVANARSPRPAAAPAERPRGTVRPDGSWDREATFPSATEHALKAIAETAIRQRLMPWELVDVIAAQRDHRWARLETIVAWRALEAHVPADLEPRARLDAAWACATTSTTAEALLRRRICKAIARNSAPETVADHYAA